MITRNKTHRFWNEIRYLLSLIFLTGVLTSWSVMAQEKPFVMSTSVGAPLYIEDGSGLFNLLVAEIFRRLNIDYVLIHQPAQRAIISTNNGSVDGTTPRAAAIEKNQHNIIRIPQDIFNFEYMAYTKDPSIKIKDWSSLKPYTVGIINGWKIIEKNVSGAKSVTKANYLDQLFTLLDLGRVDIAILDRVMGNWELKQLGLNFITIEPPLLEKLNYIYVHKRHKNLVHDINQTVIEMKKDGTYKAIYIKALSN